MPIDADRQTDKRTEALTKPRVASRDYANALKNEHVSVSVLGSYGYFFSFTLNPPLSHYLLNDA